MLFFKQTFNKVFQVTNFFSNYFRCPHTFPAADKKIEVVSLEPSYFM